MQYWKHQPNLSDLRSSASGGGHCYSSWKRTVCLRQRLHARLGVKVLKGFQLLFVPRSGMNHVPVTVEPAIFPWTIPSIRNYVHHAWNRPPPRVHGATRGLHLCEHNFHNDMRKQVRSEICGSACLHLTHKTGPAADDQRSRALCAPPKPIFFRG